MIMGHLWAKFGMFVAWFLVYISGIIGVLRSHLGPNALASTSFRVIARIGRTLVGSGGLMLDRKDSGLESDSCASVDFFAQLANDTAKGLNNTPLLNQMTAKKRCSSTTTRTTSRF